MKDTKQTNETKSDNVDGFGMSKDDLSMLNQVLQRVKGISCVSTPAYEVADPAYSNDA